MSSELAVHFSLPPRGVRVPDPGRKGERPEPKEAREILPFEKERDCPPGIEMRAILREVEEGVRNLEERVRHLAALLQENGIDLAVSLAQHILKREIQKGNYDFRSLLGDAAKAIEELGGQKKIALRVNPLDYQEALDCWERVCGESDLLSSVKVVQDEQIPRASWKVETPEGSILSRVERKLLFLRQSLMESQGESDVLCT